jgi:signal transduction histidine kinase
MTPAERPSPRPGERRPAFSASEEYSRGVFGDQSDFWEASGAAQRLQEARDASEAIAAALDALAGAGGLGATRAIWLAVDAAGATLQATAQAGESVRIPLEYGEAHPLIRALQAGRPRRLAALSDDDEFAPALLAAAGPGPYLALPVAAEDGPRGLLLVVPGGAVEKRLALAGTLARLLAEALQRIESSAARKRQSAQLGGLGETVRAILGATNLPDLLAATVRAAVRLTGGDRGLLWTYDERERALQLATHLPGRTGETVETALPGVIRLAEGCVRRGVATAYRDLREVEELGACGPEALPALVRPLDAFGDMLGAVAIIGRAEPPARAFSEEEEGVLTVLAGYAAVAIRHARLGDGARAAERRQREMHAELARVEKLANLGEMTTRLALDLRNPAAAIRAFARRIERGSPKEDPRRELARLITREARRIETMLVDPLQFARAARPRLALRSLTRVVQDAVAERRDEVQAHGAVLEEAYAEPMPDLLLDTERVRLALGNILQSALAGAARGAILRVETLVTGERVLVEIAVTGERSSAESIERLFAPFTGGPQGGAGLGLAVAHQIVGEHGGEVSVRSEGEWGAIFTVSFPVEGNRERRRSGDRRGGRERRRAGPDE